MFAKHILVLILLLLQDYVCKNAFEAKLLLQDHVRRPSDISFMLSVHQQCSEYIGAGQSLIKNHHRLLHYLKCDPSQLPDGVLFCSKIIFATTQFACHFSHFLIVQIALLHSGILFCSKIMLVKLQFASSRFSHFLIVQITLLHSQMQNLLPSTMLITGTPLSGFHQNCSCTCLCILA